MTGRKHLCLLVVVQLACVASGLGIHRLYVISAVERAAQEQPQSGLETGAEGLVLSLRRSLAAAGGITLLWMCGLLGITAYLVLAHFADECSRKHDASEVDALQRTQALVCTQESVIFGLAKLADSRDPETGGHLERISFYSSSLASALLYHPRYRDVVTPAFVDRIAISSALHDIGKVGVEDAILRKPGALTEAERSRMQCHTRIGEECLQEIEQRLGPSNFLQMAREIASCHHERWDGTGYPAGLAGEQIPLAARIVAIADVYDALSTKRVYKEAIGHEQCVGIIRSEAGKHFDPHLVEVFLKIESRFRDIARFYGTGTDAAAYTAANQAGGSTHQPDDNIAAAAAAC